MLWFFLAYLLRASSFTQKPMGKWASEGRGRDGEGGCCKASVQIRHKMEIQVTFLKDDF